MMIQALSPTETKLSIEEVFQRLDGLDSKDNALSRVEFDKMVLTYKPGLPVIIIIIISSSSSN